MMKNALIDFIRKKALFHGEFELASGQKSDYYIDLSKAVLNYHGMHLFGQAIVNEIDYTNVTKVGGPACGAIGLVSGVMAKTKWPLEGFFVRSESKLHGCKDLIDGNLDKDDLVLLIEDVTTTGQSLLKAYLAVEKIAKVTQVLTVVDREQGAKELFKDVPFKSILTIKDIL